MGSSFQAVVIRSNGFLFDPKDIDLDDIDSLTRVPEEHAWKEAMAIFGKADGQIVAPGLKMDEDTMLRSKLYTVPEAAMREMGFKDGATVVPGGEFVGKELMNCPFGRTNPLSAKCRITASFTESVDTIAILYAVTQKSKYDPNAASFFSELMLKCNCRCKERKTTAVKYSPVPGVAGECTMTPATRPALVCDNLGDKLCSHEVSDSWTSSESSKLPNGNYKCALKASKITKVTSAFAPVSPFVAPIA